MSFRANCTFLGWFSCVLTTPKLEFVAATVVVWPLTVIVGPGVPAPKVLLRNAQSELERKRSTRLFYRSRGPSSRNVSRAGARAGGRSSEKGLKSGVLVELPIEAAGNLYDRKGHYLVANSQCG